MTVELFEPLRDAMTLREAVNRLFEDSYVRPGAQAPKSRALPVDVLDAGDELIVRASLPGTDKDHMEVNFQKDTLTLKATLNGASASEESKWLLRERYQGEVSRTLVLPVPIDPDRATATYRDGVLTLTLPKSDSVKPRTIPVNAG